MDKRKKSKRKNRSSNDKVADDTRKVQKTKGPSGGSQINSLDLQVSDVLSQTNNVLYGDTSDSELDTSVFINESIHPNNRKESSIENNMAAEGVGGGPDPTNRDIVKLLQGIHGRLDTVQKKLGAIESLEKKMDTFEKDLNKLWVALDEKVKKTDERVSNLEDKIDGADIEAGLVASRVTNLEKERDTLRGDLAYIKSQSMRNNLVFTGVEEDNSQGPETAEATERKLRSHLQDALKVAKEVAESMRFERVHRSPGQPQTGRTRTIVAKFTFFKDREFVRKRWKELAETNFHMFEQFPPEVVQKRRSLITKMKDARQQGKRAYLVYDTLYIDGRPTKA